MKHTFTFYKLAGTLGLSLLFAGVAITLFGTDDIGPILVAVGLGILGGMLA